MLCSSWFIQAICLYSESSAGSAQLNYVSKQERNYSSTSGLRENINLMNVMNPTETHKFGKTKPAPAHVKTLTCVG